MTKLTDYTPVTNENVAAASEFLFAPWVKALGLTDIKVSHGKASAVLPQKPELQWANGAICGQAIMAAVDMVVSLAMLSTERAPKGTASQNTQFLRPAMAEDLLIEVDVLKFGKVIAYAETRVSLAASGDLVAHSTNEYVF